MTKDFDVHDLQQVTQSNEAEAGAPAEPRKEFIEPELSASIDVLEATTFFQSLSTGATN